MATRTEIAKQNERIREARERVLIVLEEHYGFFWGTSELASCLGVQRTYAREALEQLEREGPIKQTRYGTGKAYELTEQEPSPEMKMALYHAHLYSMTKNANGSDSHPWRNETLCCPICAKIRQCNPDWRICPGSNGKHSATHPAVAEGGAQLPIFRRRMKVFA